MRLSLLALVLRDLHGPPVLKGGTGSSYSRIQDWRKISQGCWKMPSEIPAAYRQTVLVSESISYRQFSRSVVIQKKRAILTSSKFSGPTYGVLGVSIFTGPWFGEGFLHSRPRLDGVHVPGQRWMEGQLLGHRIDYGTIKGGDVPGWRGMLVTCRSLRSIEAFSSGRLFTLGHAAFFRGPPASRKRMLRPD